MKIIFLYFSVLVILTSCANNSDPATTIKQDSSVKKQSFFPVTNYIKGQLYEIKKRGINPIKYTTVNEHTDSSWVKIEDIDETVKEFLTPQIDSTNLTSLFTEKNFLDQTIAAYTFTYDPSGPLPDSLQLKHWDVYIDPESGKIKRIYMVKEIDKSKTLQLTWQGDRYCKLVSILTDEKGNSKVEKEEKITWDF